MAARAVVPAAAPVATLWRFRRDRAPAFDPAVFDERSLAARDLLAGRADAGRGEAYFLVLDGHPLVLRHYRRGGLARWVSERHYVWTGLARTRAVREFELLRGLETQGLPAPVPFACAVTRRGPLWSGSLVMHRLRGRTLAERLAERPDGRPGGRPDGRPDGGAERHARGPGDDGAARPDPERAAGLDETLWRAIGRCIARFHLAGCRHADLNAHNVLIDGDTVHLIDFDRASWRRAGPGIARWRRANVARLRRSLEKLAERSGRAFDARGFAALERAWREELEMPGHDVGNDAAAAD